ncbi:MAG: threonylcarbamoyl-AMP synthase [Candidatus Kerfeldbacteria bacterium]|nr:threonylcarbamoyl-AMP synthase [Candidatus Kerfeldbacteria bacterium]
MEVIRVRRRLSAPFLHRVVDVLRAGGTIVFPTETSYGLGCDALKPSALRLVIAIKGRPRTKALPVIVSSRRMVDQYVRVPQTAEPFIRRWPGPLTLVLPIRRRPPSGLTGGRRSLAVRISSHPIAQQIVRVYGRPIVATSANRSGAPSLYSVRSLRRHFRIRLPDLVIDAGALPRRPASTIIACSGRRLRLIRAGAVPFPPEKS